MRVDPITPSQASLLGGARRVLSTLASAGALCAALALCGCPPKVVIIPGPIVAPVADVRWRTMQAEHRVFIDATKGDGREQLTARGLISVERPDRFRLRALGPGGVTLFDIVKVGGDIKVIQGVPGVDSALQQKVLLSIGADLAAAYDLEPAAPSRNKTVGFKEGEVRVTETERTVRLQQFKEVRGQSVPTHIVVQNTALNYTVNIDVERADLDVKLDPALFQLR